MSWLNRIAAAAAILIVLLGTNAAAAPRRVLLLHSYGPQFGPWNFYAVRLREELVKQSPDEIDLYEVYLQSARFTETEDQGPIIQYVRSLFAGRELDLIVSIGAPAAKFGQHFRPQFFPSTPLVIGAAERRAVNEAGLTAIDTYVPSTLNFTAWIENVLRVLPDTKHIAWVVGASPLERYWNEYFRRTSEAFGNGVTFEWFDGLTFDQMLKRVAELPPHSAIFYTDTRVDAAGTPLDSVRAFDRLYAAANAPMFSYVDGYFSRGIVGGPIRSSAEMGRRIASAAVRILGGESPGNIKLEPLAEGTPIYDWRELQRWGIRESSLPPESVIYFREPTAWERYRAHMLVIFAALLAQSALIGWLIYEHRRRHVAETSSRNSMTELTYVNRQAAAGALSASIAHEVSQPLSGIITSASAGLRWLAADPPNIDRAKAALAHIREAGHRAGDVITNIRGMFAKDTNQRSAVDINSTVRAVLAILRHDLQKNAVEVHSHLNDQLPVVEGNKVQLQQVILNLTMNAIEAMQATAPRILKVRSEQSESGTLHVSISDTGAGIDPVNVERVFGALFTTKERGMGMGLSICKSIIENHNGRIWVSAGSMRGTTFHFELPLKESGKAKAAESVVATT